MYTITLYIRIRNFARIIFLFYFNVARVIHVVKTLALQPFTCKIVIISLCAPFTFDKNIHFKDELVIIYYCCFFVHAVIVLLDKVDKKGKSI